MEKRRGEEEYQRRDKKENVKEEKTS
jgi:hypothetical protein